MIFVTVGTHEQQFNRLIEYMDLYAIESKEEIIMQIGYSTYLPKHCVYRKFYPYKEICNFINQAHIVVTHGGPASFLEVVKTGKVPLVVPREKKYGEHVNNHQTTFCNEIEKRYGYIKVLKVNNLKSEIQVYDTHNNNIANDLFNNDKFCKEFTVIFESLML